MGLDVYLKRCDNLAGAKAREQEASDYTDNLWAQAGDYNSTTEAQKEEIRVKTKAKNAELKLGEWGEADEIEAIEQDSKIHPDHMFKVGYLRSSYNSGGINSVLERIGCPNLYDIFEHDDGEYNFTPDWVQAQARAQDAIAKMKTFMGSEMADYDVIEVSGFDPVSSKEEALALLKKELGHKSSFGGGYSNRSGDWFMEGLQIVGAVPGRGSFMGNPTYYLFTKSEKPGGTYEWYLQALEVTLEMIDYVLAQPNPDTYYLAWSA